MRSQMRAALVILAVGLGLGTQHAWSSPLLFTFEGEITRVEDHLAEYGLDPLDPSVVVGAPFSGSFSYDPEVDLDYLPEDPTSGGYNLAGPLVGQVGEVAFQTTGPLGASVRDNWGTPPEDRFAVQGTGDGQNPGLPLDSMLMYLTGEETALASDVLPTAIALEDIYATRFELSREFGVEDFHFLLEGVITSVAIVPEPATSYLLVLSTLALLRRRSVAI